MQVPRKPVLLAVILLGAHAAVIAFLKGRFPGPILSDLIQLALGILALVTALQAAHRSGAFGRMFWRLVASGFAIWCIGQALGCYYSSILHRPTLSLWGIDVFFYHVDCSPGDVPVSRSGVRVGGGGLATNSRLCTGGHRRRIGVRLFFEPGAWRVIGFVAIVFDH